jgi:tetratricopeptide (TPR) repeat protein
MTYVPTHSVFAFAGNAFTGPGQSMLTVHLFGPMRVLAPDGSDLTPPSQKSRALIAMLLRSEGARRSRTWLAAHLWSESAREQAQASLRQTLREIRRSFGPWADAALVVDKFVIGLNPQNICASGHEPAEESDFLEGMDVRDSEFEEWLTLERSRLDSAAPVAVRAAPRPEAPPKHIQVGLRIDPPRALSQNREAEELANRVLSRCASNLMEEGYGSVRDARHDFMGMASAPSQEVHFSLSLRAAASWAKGRARVALALVDLTSETILWTQECEGDWNALLSQRDPELISLILRCVERVWSETERKMTQMHQEGDGPESLRSAIQDMFELGSEDLDHAALELRKLLPGKFGAIAGAWLAFLSTFRVGQRFVNVDGPLHEEARFLVTRALERDPDNALIQALAGHVHSYLLGNQMKAVELFEQSIRLNPTRALAWDLYSVLHAYMGMPQAGLKAAQFGRHLGALSPYRYYFDTSCLIAASMAGQHELAVEYGESVLRDRPEFNSVLRFLTSSYGHMGEKEKAKAARMRLLEVEPTFSVKSLREAGYPGLDTPSGKYFIQGLKKAGIKEGES